MLAEIEGSQHCCPPHSFPPFASEFGQQEPTYWLLLRPELGSGQQKRVHSPLSGSLRCCQEHVCLSISSLTHLPTCPSVHPFIYPSSQTPTHLSISTSVPSLYLLSHSSVHALIPHVHSSIYPSTHIFIHPSAHLFIHPSTHSSVQPSFYLSIYAPTHPLSHPSNHPHVYLSIQSCMLSTHLFFRSSIHPIICPSIHPSVHYPSIPHIQYLVPAPGLG